MFSALNQLAAALHRWRFHLQELGSRHWVSVARGPIEDVVDALKGFTATFGRPRPEPDEYEVNAVLAKLYMSIHVCSRLHKAIG